MVPFAAPAEHGRRRRGIIIQVPGAFAPGDLRRNQLLRPSNLAGFLRIMVSITASEMPSFFIAAIAREAKKPTGYFAR